MFVAVKITAELVELVKKRRNALREMIPPRIPVRRRFWQRKPKPDAKVEKIKETLQFYDALPLSQISGYSLKIGDMIYLSPAHAAELFGIVYGFEISTASISTASVTKSKIAPASFTPPS